MRRGAFLLGTLAVLLGSGAGAFDLGALLDSVVETYGGPSAVARMQAMRVEAEVSALLVTGQGTGRVVRDFQAPDRLRVEIAYPGSTEVRILDGLRGWRGDSRQLQQVAGPPRVAMEYQLLRSAVPWVFVQHRKRIQDRGEADRDGAAYRRVGLPWSADLDLTYWIDAVSRRVAWVEGVLGPPGSRISFLTQYRDFRRVEGLLVPHAEENYAGGRHTGTTRVTAVVFSPPDLGPFDPTRLER